MKFRKIVFLSIISTISTILGQSPQLDTSIPVPISPNLRPRESKFDFSGHSIAWAGNYIPNVAFFPPTSDKLDETYLPIIDELARRMVQNPDLRCHIRGYFSHEFDGIVSPSEGYALASRRGEALREALILSQPQLMMKITVASSGYYTTDYYGVNPSIYDLRAEIVPYILDWNERVIVATDAQPYWRRGFRQISESWGGFLSDVLDRNPDMILLFSSGELGVSPEESAGRIDAVVSRFSKDMKRSDMRQMVAVHGGISKPGEMVIDLVPSFFAPEPLNGRLLWFEAQRDVAPVRLELGLDTSSTAHSYRIDRDMNGSRAPVEWGMRRPTALSLVHPKDGTPLLIPPSCEFSMVAWGDNSLVERSKWQPVEIAFGPEYTEIAIVPIIPFKYESIEPRLHWETALAPIVSRLQILIKQAGALSINITGHANEIEENASSLAEQRAEFLWARLSEALMAIYGKDSLAGLGDYLKGKAVAVEIEWEVHSVNAQENTMTWMNAALTELPPEFLAPHAAMATMKWEFRCEK